MDQADYELRDGTMLIISWELGCENESDAARLPKGSVITSARERTTGRTDQLAWLAGQGGRDKGGAGRQVIGDELYE